MKYQIAILAFLAGVILFAFLLDMFHGFAAATHGIHYFRHYFNR
jgi:hypothetical protein